MKSDYKWLDKWEKKIKGKSVLELGAGSGIDTQILRGVVSHLTAVDLIRNEPNGIEELDHSQPLPYESNSFDAVIVSLCLHYFKWSKTEEIICELHRVLRPNGILIGRVNSKKDSNYGAKGYPEIEPGLYQVNDQAKRFFEKGELNQLFQEGWVISSIEEKEIDRYKYAKTILEFMAVCT